MFGNEALFLGCVVRNAFPEIGERWAAIARVMGKRLIRIPEEICCGTPLLNAGEREAFERQREKLRGLFRKYHVKRVYSPCPSCVQALSDLVDAHHAIELVDTKKLRQNVSLRVVFHDPCHLSRGLHLSDMAREILRASGCNVVEPDFYGEFSYCCGGGAGLPSNAPDVAERLADERARQLIEKSPDVVVTACPMCLHMLRKKICSCVAPVWDISRVVALSLGLEA